MCPPNPGDSCLWAPEGRPEAGFATVPIAEENCQLGLVDSTEISCILPGWPFFSAGWTAGPSPPPGRRLHQERATGPGSAPGRERASSVGSACSTARKRPHRQDAAHPRSPTGRRPPAARRRRTNADRRHAPRARAPAVRPRLARLLARRASCLAQRRRRGRGQGLALPHQRMLLAGGGECRTRRPYRQGRDPQAVARWRRPGRRRHRRGRHRMVGRRGAAGCAGGEGQSGGENELVTHGKLLRVCQRAMP